MGTPLHVLIVEDVDDDAELLVRELRRQGYAANYQRVETAEAMRAALTAKPWDLVISDYAMPQFSALDALAVLRSSGLDLPFIIMSGTIDEETAFLAGNPHEQQLLEICRVAGVDFGRVDYAVLDGEVQVWEINTNAMMTIAEDHDPRRVHALDAFAGLLADGARPA